MIMKNMKMKLLMAFLVSLMFRQGAEVASPFTTIDSVAQGLKADSVAQGLATDSVARGLKTDSTAASRKPPTVTVEADNITHYADRDVVYITRSMRKGARNTAQILGNIPGIDCNRADNKLTYYGSSNILILVDSVEKSANYVKELHHLRYDKVDVIPHPMGKYSEYDLMINLHTKPDYEGYERNAHQEVGIQPTEDNGKDKKFTWNYTSTSFTYTKNKWNVVGRYNFNFSQSDRSNTESTYTNHISHMRENSTAPMRLVNFFRIHNAYFAVDHQINKNHSVSVSYNYSTDASDDYKYASTERLWLDNEEKDTIMKEATRRNSVSRVNSDRHTLGLYYRDRSGAWNYNYDFNYINDGWDSDKNYWQSTSYSSDDYFRKHRNHVWTQSEVNHNFFDNRFYSQTEMVCELIKRKLRVRSFSNSSL